MSPRLPAILNVSCLLLFPCLIVPLHAQDAPPAVKPAVQPAAKKLTITVLGPDGAPVEGARVLVMQHDMNGKVKSEINLQTDAKGQVARDAPADKTRPVVSLTIYAPGFALASGYALDEDKTFRLEAATTVSGTLQDAKGKPLAGVSVRLNTIFDDDDARDFPSFMQVPDALKDSFSAKTNDDGIWTIKDVPTHGTAGLQVDDARFAHTRLQTELSAAPVKIEVRKLSAGATIRGRVMDEAGKPVGSVQVFGGPEERAGAMDKAYGEAKTAADGTFSLTGLDTGAYHVLTNDEPKDLVSQGETKVRTVAGETVKLPDIVLVKGALLQGTVKDAGGAPIEGAIVYNNHDEDYRTASSDKTGRYSLRVPFGRNGIYIGGLPEGYIYGQTGSPYNVTKFEIKKGETKTFNFTLEKGLTLAGTARDEKGLAVKDAKISVRGAGESDFAGPRNNTVVDDSGRWSVKGLKPGKATLSAGGDWEIVSPKEVMLPTRAPVVVVLRKATFVEVKGRVVSAAGTPIEGANVQIQILIPMGGGSYSGNNKKVITDAEGRFVIPKVRPEHKVQSATITKAGYKFVSGGKVSKKAGYWEVTDAVLQALTNRIAGRVIDAAGAPVEGAQVLAPSGGPKARAQTDATGHFEIKGLPENSARVIAASSQGYGEVSGQGQNLDIALKPHGALTPRDIERGFELLKQSIIKAPRDRYSTVQQFAVIDPDRALQLAQLPGDNAPAATFETILDTLIEQDPKRAATWVPPHLDEIKSPRNRFDTTAHLALAVADFNPELFETLYARVQKDYAALKNGDQERDQYWHSILMGQLASKHGDLDAEDYWNKALTLAIRSPDNNADGAREGFQTNGLVQSVVTSAAPYNLEFALFAASQLPPRDKTMALSSVISELVKVKNFRQARDLLEKLSAIPNQDAESNFSQSAVELIKATGKDDPAGALALARRVESEFEKGTALALAARFQPKDEAIKLLREAATLTPDEYGTRVRAEIALIAFEFDPALTKEILTPELEGIEAKLRGEEEVGASDNANIAPFAYAYGFVDAPTSRLLIEAEFARQLTVPVEGYNSQLTELTRAMASLDLERALQMADALAALNKDLGVNARAEVTGFLLATPDERREMFSEG